MPTPKKGYYLQDGTRVPGVTTVLSNVNLGSNEGLLAWANKMGQEGKSHREVRDIAADAGTCAHDMVESSIRGWEFVSSKYTDDAIAKAQHAFHAYEAWASQTKLTVVTTETQLVSETHRYGGTMDALLIDGQLSLGDWKTSNGIYVPMLCQLAAYGHVWEENNPSQPIRGGFHLLRFSKPGHEDDPVHFAHHYWANLDIGWEAFAHMRVLYDLNARLRKLV